MAGEAGVMKVEVLLNQTQSLNQQLTQLTIYTTTPRRRSVGRQYAMAHGMSTDNTTTSVASTRWHTTAAVLQILFSAVSLQPSD